MTKMRDFGFYRDTFLAGFAVGFAESDRRRREITEAALREEKVPDLYGPDRRSVEEGTPEDALSAIAEEAEEQAAALDVSKEGAGEV